MGHYLRTSTDHKGHESLPSTPGAMARLGHDPFALAKARGTAYEEPRAYEDIRVPKNNPMGVGSGLVFGALLGFGLTWHVWWLAILAALGGIAAIIAYGVARTGERTVPAPEVEQETTRWLRTVEETAPVARSRETTPANRGLADHNA